MNLLTKFYGEAKKHQIVVIKMIEDALKNGYKNIILCAPTGTGKSYIAMCLALSYDSSSILTATTDLQEQYARDFPFVKTIKGRRNFECLRIINQKVKCDNVSSSLCYNKSEGFCQYYPHQDNFSIENRGIDEKIIYNGNKTLVCQYYKQKFEALLASHTVFNYYEYLSLLKFTKQAPYRTVMVFDEAHLLENRLVEFYGLSINKKLIMPVNMQFPSQLYDINNWAQFLYKLRDAYISLMNDIFKRFQQAKGNEFIRLNDEISNIESNLERIEFIYNEISNNLENYVVTIERDGKGIVKANLLPIEISKYTHDLFNMSKVRLFMSATIDYDTFCKSLALDKNDTIFINVDSPFPVENRRVYFLNRYTLNKNNMNDASVIKIVAKSIEEIMDKHKNERGLILVTNYTFALELKNKLSNKKRLIVSNEIKREEIINALASGINNVIISPSLWEGIDLKDELCRFIIIAKAPYLDLNNRRIAVKMRKDMEWYTIQSAMRLIQGCGRGVRHDNDYCTIYVLDKNATHLIKKVEDKLPEWFRKACVFKE